MLNVKYKLCTNYTWLPLFAVQSPENISANVCGGKKEAFFSL